MLRQLDETPALAAGGHCLVVMRGPDLGQRIRFETELTMGRDPERDLVLDLDGISRKHCRIQVRGGIAFLMDEGSTNGTHINNRRVGANEESVLRSGDLVDLGEAVFKFIELGSTEDQFHDEVHRSMVLDPLTQVYNRAYLRDYLVREIARCKRYDRPLVLLMFDVDHFKRINDEHGHLAGDHVLAELARAAQGAVRREVCLARYGGEEFAIVSPETTIDEARAFGERMRGVIEALRLSFDGRDIPVTISVGAAAVTQGMTEPEHLIEATDRKLYEAKSAGRNTVCV